MLSGGDAGRDAGENASGDAGGDASGEDTSGWYRSRCRSVTEVATENF